jgi:hypothetical protein
MTFERIYHSSWHHPVALVAFGGATLAYVLARVAAHKTIDPFFRVWATVCGVEILVDAYLTSDVSPFKSTALAVAFVILGDARVYVLLERFRHEGVSPARAVTSGLALGSLVSVLTGPLSRVIPAMQDTRVLFLVYELCALVQVLVWRGVRGRRSWLDAIVGFVAVQYLLWATADVLILAGLDLGYGLRIIPNVLYYGVFVAFACGRAPRER